MNAVVGAAAAVDDEIVVVADVDGIESSAAAVAEDDESDYQSGESNLHHYRASDHDTFRHTFHLSDDYSNHLLLLQVHYSWNCRRYYYRMNKRSWHHRGVSPLPHLLLIVNHWNDVVETSFLLTQC